MISTILTITGRSILSLSILIGGSLLFFRFYIRTLAVPCKSYTCLVGKTVIVTGANTGIGFYTALDLAKRGASVILACRNEAKANAAKESIIQKTGNRNIVVKLVDFQSLQSVRDFAKDINEIVDNIHILVNNTGIAYHESVKTDDGFEPVWQTNYFGPFLLTILLLDKLRKSGPSRVVNIASNVAARAKFDLSMVNQHHRSIYKRTKQANILFTRELARRIIGSGVTVFALHPGYVNTELFNTFPKWLRVTLTSIAGICFKTPEEGAQTSIYCSVAKECEDESGQLYDECAKVQMYDSCKDMQFAKALWEKTTDLLKIPDDLWN